MSPGWVVDGKIILMVVISGSTSYARISLHGDSRGVLFSGRYERKAMVEEKDRIEGLLRKLRDCLSSVKLGVAGRILCYDKELNIFLLLIHAASPDKTHEATTLAWGNIPEDLKMALSEANIGFAGKQI